MVFVQTCILLVNNLKKLLYKNKVPQIAASLHEDVVSRACTSKYE